MDIEMFLNIRMNFWFFFSFVYYDVMYHFLPNISLRNFYKAVAQMQRTNYIKDWNSCRIGPQLVGGIFYTYLRNGLRLPNI